jgi:uncharacterized protein (UPF0335 family)
VAKAKTRTAPASHEASQGKSEIVNRDALGRFVTRIEILRDDRKGINDTLKEVYEEVRQAGMDAETVRQMVRERELDPQIRQDQYALRDEYRRALGLYLDTPLGQSAMRSASELQRSRGEAGAMEPSVTEAPTVNGRAAKKPRPFAKQTVHDPRRSRKRKSVDDGLAEARAHLGGEPAGTA